jgi:NTE family protein
MVDTAPLRSFLHGALGAQDGQVPGIERNIADGRVSAVAITACNYVTGQTITFVQGKAIQGWERPLRRGINTSLTVEHVMASAALPLVFPPVRIENSWYGDGGVRLVAPLAPALHLGADRLLVLSTHFAFPESPPDGAKCDGAPSPAVVLGALYNAVFLDQLDHDVLQMDRINRLVQSLPPEQRLGFRNVQTSVVRPSGDLGDIANEYESELPRTFRYFMRRFGSSETKSQDLVSTVMFHEGYISKLLEMGERDAGAYAEQVRALLAP